MNSRIIFIHALFILWALSVANAQSMERKVFSPLGGKTQSGQFYFSFTLGEPIVGTDDNSLPIFTKGFEQPIDPAVLEYIRREEAEGEIAQNFSLYPNPFSNQVQFQYNSERKGPKDLYLLNASAALIKQISYHPEELSASVVWDMSDLPDGSYWLIVSDQGARAVFSLRKE